MPRSTSGRAACCASAPRRIASRPPTSGGDTRIWRSKPPGPQQRGVELLEQVRRGDHDEFAGRREAVHLDEQLIERLLALGVVVRPAHGADGVDLVDEDDRRRVLARLAEQPPDARLAPRPANISTKLEADCAKNCAPDSLATALASNVLPVPGGPCSRMPFGTLAPSSLKRAGLAQEVDDLLQLGLGLVGPGDLVPFDRGVGVGLDLLRLRLRHQPHRPPQEEDDQPHEGDRAPQQHEALDLLHQLIAASIGREPGLAYGVWTLFRFHAQDLGERRAARPRAGARRARACRARAGARSPGA